MARAPLPLMDYNSLVGDQQQRQQVPLMQNMPTAGPMAGPAPQPQPKTYEEICQSIASAQQRGILSQEQQMRIEAGLARMGYPPMSRCPQNMTGPFQNETVQYLLLFLLAYVVIKKL